MTPSLSKFFVFDNEDLTVDETDTSFSVRLVEGEGVREGINWSVDGNTLAMPDSPPSDSITVGREKETNEPSRLEAETPTAKNNIP